MKIKSQDLKPGMLVSFNGSPKVRLSRVAIFKERAAPFTGIGKSAAYFPACVLVAWPAVGRDGMAGENTFSFMIDEVLDRHFMEE